MAEPEQPRGVVLLRLAYVALLVLATLAPFEFRFESRFALDRLAAALAPAYSPAHLVDAVRNIALFGGWGALWAATSSARALPATLLPALLTGLGLSVTVELVQLFLPHRNTSVLDVAMNGLGTVAGVLLILGLVAALRTRTRDKSHVGMPAGVFAGAYLMAMGLEAVFAPFRLRPLPGVHGGPLTRMSATLESFNAGDLTLPLGDILLFAPLGWLAVMALIEAGWERRGALGAVIGLGAVFALLTEGMHGFLALPIQSGAALLHAAAIAAGAGLAWAWLPRWTRELRGRDRPLSLLLAYGLVLLVWALRPYVLADAAHIVSSFSLSRLVPLQGSAPRLDLYSVADIMESCLLFLPLGALLAVWPARIGGFVAGCWPGILVAVIGELLQPFLAARYFDVTDILVAVAGLGFGWTVMRHAGFPVHGTLLPSAR